MSSSSSQHACKPDSSRTGRWDGAFLFGLLVITFGYVGLIVLLLVADVTYILPRDPEGWSGWLRDNPLLTALRDPAIRDSIILSLVSCTLSAILSVWVAVPVGYVLTRLRVPGRRLIDAILDIPIVLPPLVIGLSLLILFQLGVFAMPLGEILPVHGPIAQQSLRRLVVYQVPAVVLAQFVVAAAFAVRTMKATFEQLDSRCEQVALTLGCSRAQAFTRIVMPGAGKGILTAFTLAWARSLGEFGPLLIFAGATRHKTEVLSTTVFLQLSVGDISGAVAVSLIMVVTAIVVLVITRCFGQRDVMV